ncbi:hypothetical protein FQR65_LT09949 [Abscondita terminalis]|nr:hypothetical protein FQR65_LT09949 [Abscondita terminalis]
MFVSNTISTLYLTSKITKRISNFLKMVYVPTKVNDNQLQMKKYEIAVINFLEIYLRVCAKNFEKRDNRKNNPAPQFYVLSSSNPKDTNSVTHVEENTIYDDILDMEEEYSKPLCSNLKNIKSDLNLWLHQYLEVPVWRMFIFLMGLQMPEAY